MNKTPNKENEPTETNEIRTSVYKLFHFFVTGNF